VKQKALVAILMGSESDLEVMTASARALRDLGVPFELHVLSAHRSPDKAARFARTAASRGLRVIICGAGGAAHLAGAVSAQTILPVIGVPLAASDLSGLDALLATVQMPGGIPVATVAIGKAGATNAGLLAAQILATSDARLAKRLQDQKKEMYAKVAAMSASAQRRLPSLLGPAKGKS
jgi:phosphoribosylaminoimidazole carboxylase PurE protein